LRHGNVQLVVILVAIGIVLAAVVLIVVVEGTTGVTDAIELGVC
jgi:hypothetical protein